MDGRHRSAVQRCVELAPLACWHHRACGQAHGLEHARDDDWVGREHLPEQADARLVCTAAPGRLYGAVLNFFPRKTQHGARQHILGLGMGGNAKTGHIDTDDAHTVDFPGQQLQRHAAGGRYTQVDDDDGVQLVRIGLVVDRLTDVFEQLAGNQRLGVERHITHAAAGAVEMAGECETVDAAGRAGKNGERTAHAQAYAQRTESRAHALRLVVRSRGRIQRIVFGVLCQHVGFSCGLCRGQQLFTTRMAAHAVTLEAGRCDGNDGNGCGHGSGCL